ncbi:MAG: hypothetical protein V2J14_01180, partial [Erythrobacter sp.]|nr:hypothetical protein [Erythrobacter sp.]
LPDPPPPPPEPGPSAAERAHARGLAEGRAEAASAAEAELAAERARFASLRLAFRRLDAAATEALAQDLQATVLALCEGVLGEYGHDTEALLARCQRAAQRLGAGPASTGGEPALTLHLHPDTRRRLDPAALPGWALADDPALDPGGLRLTGERGAVRDTPADWMRAITEALGA